MDMKYKRSSSEGPPELIPTRFAYGVDRQKRQMKDLAPPAKVVAALTKCLAKHSQAEGISFFVSGDNIYCPVINVTPGPTPAKGKYPTNSYSAKGRFQLGRAAKDGASYTMIQFDIAFRDGLDDMGLPDLVIEQANMTDLGRSAPLKE